MNRKCTVLLAAALFLVGGVANVSAQKALAAFPSEREPELWPFAWDSIWNIPIGNDAVYVPAGIQTPTGLGMTVDEDIIILEPDAPQVDIVAHDAGWSDNLRCESIVEPIEVLESGVPIPTDFTTDPDYDGLRPNHAAAILLPDGETIVQNQPFHRCGADGPAVSQYTPPNDNIKTGDGIRGAHGGSGMSSLGGTIRVGELVPGGIIRHALKLNLYGDNYFYYDEMDASPGYRWPAIRADSYAADRYGGVVPELEMGALLALKPDFNIEALNTEPAKIIARAFMDYGGYAVDDTAWDVYALETEWGPNGRVLDEFEQTWGHGLKSGYKPATCNISVVECQWVVDMETIFTSLHVVDDNSAETTGGAGSRRQPCAPPFPDGTGGAPISACSLPTAVGIIKTGAVDAPSAATVAVTFVALLTVAGVALRRA